MPLIRFLSARIPNQGCLIEKEVVLLGNLGRDRLVSWSTCMGHDCNANNLHVFHSVKTCCDWQRSKHATEPGTVKVSPCFNYFSRISKLLQRLRSNATTLVLCQTVPLSQQKNRQTASMMKVHPRYVGKCVEQLVRNMTESKK